MAARDVSRRRALLTMLEPRGRPRSLRGSGAVVRSVWTTVDGLRVHARVATPAKGTVSRDVVLVHGSVVSSRYMIPVALQLAARGLRSHAPDLPGFGHSDGPPAVLDAAGLAEALIAWIEACGLERPVLVANSFGCRVSIEALVRRPGGFDRAVLQGPTVDPTLGGPARQAVRWVATGLREPPSLNAILARDVVDCGWRRALATVRQVLSAGSDPDVSGVDAPVLVVRGGDDRTVSPAWAEVLASGFAHGRVVVLPGVAHALCYSAAPQLAAVVRRFLDEPAHRTPPPWRSAARSVASFDSATATLRASAGALRARGQPAVGAVPRPLAPLAERLLAPLNDLPPGLRRVIYRRASGAEAIPPERLHTVSAEAIARWAADRHPRRQYPAAIVGAPSGAIAHLAAALGAPFLPQTFLVPVAQRGIAPDDPRAALRLGYGPAQLLLDANPDVQLHHMHDPNQDRLTVARMAYFRIKRRRLGEAYAGFLTDTLPRGATLLVSDCRLRWPVTHVGDRHLFQFGALGGLPAGEFHRGSPRVAEDLRRRGAGIDRWDPPPPDGDAPEAEWGFEPSLLDDLAFVAERRGLRLRRVCFDDPEDLSPLVADLHRWWYRRRGLPARRLLVESFVLLDAWWAIRTGSAPLWLKFAVEASADRLERYLADTEPYDDVRLALLSHGADGLGVAPIERWRAILPERQGRFLGVDETRFPADFASFGRFHRELRALDERRWPPRALALGELDEFLDQRAPDDGVAWLGG